MPRPARIPGRRLLPALAALGLSLGAGGRPLAVQEPETAPEQAGAELAAWIGQLRSGVDLAGEELSPQDEDVLVARIVDEPREVWLSWVELLAQAPAGHPDRRLAVRLLGAGGHGSDLGHLARLAEVEQSGELLARSFADALESAVTALLRREPSACVVLRRVALDAPPGVRRSLATALGGLGGPRALEELAALLAYDPALDPTVLAQLARVARPLPKPADPTVVLQVRRCLTSEDPQVVAMAAECLGALEDVESVELLLGYLDHDAACVRGSVHRALKTIAGVELPPQRARWEPWIAEEQAWFAQHAPAAVEQLASRNRMTLFGALSEIGMHRLHRRDMALEVVVLLERASADERSLACQTLGQLGSGAAVPFLMPLLDDESPPVRAAAWAALRAITGSDLPAEGTAWAAWAAGESSS